LIALVPRTEATCATATWPKIADQGAQRALSFAGTHTVGPNRRDWVLRLRAPDGMLYRIDSSPCWRALLGALKAARQSPPSAG